MIKKIYLLLFTICCCSIAQAQSTFEKVIDTLGASHANCVQMTYDGGYVLCGKSSYNGNDVLILKLDSVGIIEWAKTYSGPSIESGLTIEQLPDSGYIVDALYDGGSTPQDHRDWLLRLDVNGDTLWTKIFSVNTGSIFPFKMAINTSYHYGLTGYSNLVAQSEAYLIISDSIGNLTVGQVYHTPNGSKSFGICKKNQNFVFTGAYLTSPNSMDVYLVNTDSIGDTLWTHTYDYSNIEYGNAVEQTSDGGFIIIGNIWNLTVGASNAFLIKTKANGDTVWVKSFGDTTTIEGNSVQQTNNGGYIVTARIVNGTPLNANVYLLKTNASGDSLWTRQFGANGADVGYFVRQTDDGGYIICGSGSDTSGRSGVYLIKTDSMGYVQSSTGVAELNNSFQFTAYPNPSNGIFTIDLKGIPYTNAVLEIYNLYQQCVYTCTIKNHVTETIDLSSQAAGMYVAVLKTKAEIFSRKIIIQQ